MRQVLLAGVATALGLAAASAADLPRSAPPVYVAPPPLFSWTGVYIGTYTSYLFTDRQRITSTGNDPFTQSLFAAGVVPPVVSSQVEKMPKVGGGFGVNYQLTPGSGIVIGGALAIDWTDVNKNVLYVGTPLAPALAGGVAGVRLTSVFNQTLDYLGTVNGRIGYAWNTVLVYGTGGFAVGKARYGASIYFPGLGLVGNGADGHNETGFNYGGGIEVALPKDNIFDKFDVLRLIGIEFGGTSTLKAEYIRYDLGSRNVVAPSFAFPGTSGTARFHSEGSIIRAGFNYKFP